MKTPFIYPARVFSESVRREPSKNPPFDGRLAGFAGGRGTVVALAAALLLLAESMLGLSTAKAVPTMTVDIKAHYSVFVAGSTADLPVYFVENRAATDESWVGKGRLCYVRFDFLALGSEFISFTPIAAFDKVYTNHTYKDPSKGESRIYASLESTNGVGVTVDNSGITGRTEIFIGTLRVKVGPAIRQGNQWIVFDTTLHADPSWGMSVPTLLLPGGARQNHTNMATRQLRFYSTELPREDRKPPVISITAPKTTGTYPRSKKITIKGTAKDNVGLDRWQYKLNGGGWKEGGALVGKSRPWSKRIGKAKVGRNTVQVRAYDWKGLVSKTAKRNVTLKK